MSTKYIQPKRIGRSTIKAEGKIAYRIKGLIRINSDLITIIEILQAVISKEAHTHNHFNDYQSIIITYRKCFDYDKRHAQLTEKKHLKNATKEQEQFHQRLMDLGNTHVAHPVKEEYDRVHLSLIIDNNSKYGHRY